MRINREKMTVAMLRLELNSKQVAQKTGLSRGTITAVKNGKSCAEETAKKLVALLGPGIIKKED